MNEPGRVLVIGGGVVGLCSAYYLSRTGVEVLVVEQADIGAGASSGNAGLLVTSHCTPLAAPGVVRSGLKWMFDPESPFYIKPRCDLSLLRWLWQFCSYCNHAHVLRSIPVLRALHLASFQLYQELNEQLNGQFGFEQRGLLMPYITPTALEDGIREAKLLAEHGIEYQLLESGEAHSMIPQLSPEVIGAIYYPGEGHLNPAMFLRALAGHVQQSGVKVLTGTEVIGWRLSNSRVTIVETTRGDLAAEAVVLAAGAWSARIAEQLNLRLPIQPAKGYSITVQRPEGVPPIPILSSETRIAITPMGETLRLSGTLELAGLDLSINRRRVEALLRGARRVINGLEQVEVKEIWRGLRPCTPDGLPIIGHAPGYDNLVIAAGHATIGQSLGPITGKLVCEIVLGCSPALDISPFRPERFRRVI